MTDTAMEMTSEQLHTAWLEHPHFKYRGCAPDADNPLRMAGNPDLHVGAHEAPDAFAPEGQIERREREERAIEVCLNCPVMVQCDAYASSVVWVKGMPKLAEPDGVWGGRRRLERHRALIKSRLETVAAPDRTLQTPQKRAVLRALASCWDPFEVAAAAGMDVRKANWQRSVIVTKLGLPKDVSRMRALAVARERGLLEGVDIVADDGKVPALAPPTKVPELALAVPVVVVPAEAAPEGSCRGVRPRRKRVTAVTGQLSFFDDALTHASVSPLFPTEPLEAAA